MTKNEFTETLRRHISSVGDYNFVNETVEYYQNYIEMEMRAGRTEEEVLDELGDPRLIAKSIMASHGMGSEDIIDDEPAQSASSPEVFTIRTKTGKQVNLPIWLAKTAGIAIAVGAIALIGFLAVKLLPVICVAVLAYLVVKFIKDNF